MNFREHRTFQIEPIFSFKALLSAQKWPFFACETGIPSANASLLTPFREVAGAADNFGKMACLIACGENDRVYGEAGDPRSQSEQPEQPPPNNSEWNPPAGPVVEAAECFHRYARTGGERRPSVWLPSAQPDDSLGK